MNMKSVLPKIGLYLALILVSCSKDFLDQVPLGSQVASSTSDYDQLMNSPDFYYYKGGNWLTPELMGDDVAAEGPFFNQGSVTMQRLFQWQDVIYPANEGVEPVDLSTQLANLYTVNKIINEVMGSTGGTDSQKISLRAEALATRAWLNFQFICFYGKPYQVSSAATDPGWPIIKIADIAVQNYTRASVQQVYDFILQDLDTAILSLPITPKIRTRMSRSAAEGLKGKVLLFMGRYSDALPEFNAAFSDLATSGDVVLYDYNVTMAPGGSFQPFSPFNGPNGPGNNQNDLTEAVILKVFFNGPMQSVGASGSQNAGVLGNNGLVLTPQTAALYDPSDWRLQLYSPTFLNNTPNPSGRLRKYGISFSRFGLQLSELYLLSAECKARLNDLSGAVTDVGALRVTRLPPAAAGVPPAVASDQLSLIKFIIDERTREFAAEGYRWFDMRRLSVDPLFAGQTFTHTMYNDDSTNSTTSYTLRQPQRLTLQLPQAFINANPGMQNNP